MIFEHDSTSVSLKLNEDNNTSLEGLLGILKVMSIKVWNIVGTLQIQ